MDTLQNSAYGGALRIKGTLEGSRRSVQMKLLFKALFGSKSLNGDIDDVYPWDCPSRLVMEVGEQVSDIIEYGDEVQGSGNLGMYRWSLTPRRL